MKAIVVSGGELSLNLLSSYIDKNKNDIIISVDAAVVQLEKLQITPDIMVGDFDTLSDDDLLKKFAKKGIKIIRHNPIKDFSDSELAIDCAYKAGIREVKLLGALGRRFDHTFANVLILLKYKKKGMDIVIFDKYNKMYFKSKPFTLKKRELWGKYISFFAFGAGVHMKSLTGVVYPVKDKEVNSVTNPSLFVSNEITDEYMSAVFYGDLLVVESRD